MIVRSTFVFNLGHNNHALFLLRPSPSFAGLLLRITIVLRVIICVFLALHGHLSLLPRLGTDLAEDLAATLQVQPGAEEYHAEVEDDICPCQKCQQI